MLRKKSTNEWATGGTNTRRRWVDNRRKGKQWNQRHHLFAHIRLNQTEYWKQLKDIEIVEVLITEELSYRPLADFAADIQGRKP
jgi:hypothetical protein